MNGVWGYGAHKDADMWTGMADTREEAIEEGRSDFGDESTFYVMHGVMADPLDLLPDADRILEDMQQNAHDNGAPDIDEPVTLKDGAEEALEALLRQWAAQYVETNYWVADSEAERIEPEQEA